MKSAVLNYRLGEFDGDFMEMIDETIHEVRFIAIGMAIEMAMRILMAAGMFKLWMW